MVSLSTLSVESRTGNIAAPSPERSAARAYGRRRSDRPRLPEWLNAPLYGSGEPCDGDWLDVCEARAGDYLFEFHESDRTASWLRILSVAVVDGSTLVTFGRGDGVTVSYRLGRHAWVLPIESAAVLAAASSDRVLRAWGEPEQSMESFLRSFASQADLVKRWPFTFPSVADAVTAWELLREADEANRTDVPPTVLAVAK